MFKAIANETLYQLSYTPTGFRTADLEQARRAVKGRLVRIQTGGRRRQDGMLACLSSGRL